MGEFSQIEIIFDVSSSHKFSLHMKLLSWIQWLDCYKNQVQKGLYQDNVQYKIQYEIKYKTVLRLILDQTFSINFSTAKMTVQYGGPVQVK